MISWNLCWKILVFNVLIQYEKTFAEPSEYDEWTNDVKEHISRIVKRQVDNADEDSVQPSTTYTNKVCQNEDGTAKESFTFHDPDQCTLFYICFHGKLYETHCGAKLAYDVESQDCVPAADVPGCKSQCEETCLNGGTCIGLNICKCPGNYHGYRCLYLGYSKSPDIDVDVDADIGGRMCTMFGAGNVVTFDGLVYDFPGTCQYEMASSEGVPDFKVLARKNPKCTQDGKYVYDQGNCIMKVTILIASSNIKVTISSTEVTLNGKVISLPFDADGVMINRMYPFVTFSLGEMFIKFDRETTTLHLILARGRYQNTTRGLCGNFNSDKSDDLVSKQGATVAGMSTGHIVAKTWIERDVNEVCHDIDTVTENFTECRNEQVVESICNIMWAEFEKCHDKMDPSPFYDLCKTELCRCDYMKRADCQCEMVTLYSRSCGLAGGVPSEWRSVNQCLRGCPGSQEWIECGKESPQSCIVPRLLPNQLCFDRCQCPYGRYEDKGDCTVLANCPCIDKGIEYKPGEKTSTLNCNECTCDAGQWRCNSSMCPGQAHIFGFSHFKTFDDRFYTFDGLCQYVFAKDCGDRTFTMYLEAAECGVDPGLSCVKTFTVELTLFGQSQKIALRELFTVRINNYDVELPYQAGGLHITRVSSIYVHLYDRKTGVQVLWNGHDTVFVTVPVTYRDKLCGLAGNYNGNAADDFISSQNIIESTPASFANSWKLNDDCKDNEEGHGDPCQINSDKERWAKEACGRIYKDPFTACHNDVDPEYYYRNCMYEFCECTKDITTECTCNALAVYAQKCSSVGKVVEWRSKHFCGIKCSGRQVFQACGSGCGKTCQSLSEPEECADLCVEGCNCPDGQYLSPEGQCVDDADCPCYHLGTWYQPGRTLHTAGSMCQCIRGHIECEGEGTLPSLCPTGQVFRNCSQQGSFNQNAVRGAECTKTCVNKDLPCPLTLCVSGCTCPSDLVWHDERCIKASQCPCYHNNKQYEHGSAIDVDCNQCSCRSGSWKCSHKSCVGQCHVTGEAHFKTFDDRWFDFAGDCSYVIATDECGSSEGTFKVFVKSNPCETLGYVCSRTVTIQLGANQIVLEKGKEPDLTTLAESNGVDVQYVITKVGFFTVLQSEIGLNLFWDRATRVYIQLRASHNGKVCGLCGNFNGDDSDDFLMRSQEVVASSNVFGNNWRLKESCPKSNYEKQSDMCDKYPARKAWAMRQCKIIESDAFKECRKEIDHTKYLEHCLSDTCGCEAGGDCECFCSSVASYAHACGQIGIKVNWRTPELCPTMCELYNKNDTCEWHYEACGTSCPDTCCNRNNRQHCGLPCLEGCHPHCKAGTVFSPEQQTCVDESTCGPCPTTTTTTTAPTTTVTTTATTTVTTTVTTPCPDYCYDEANNVTRKPGEKWYDSTCSQLECTYYGDECPSVTSSTKSCVLSIECPAYKTSHKIVYSNPADDPDPCCEELECVCKPEGELESACPSNPTCNEYEDMTPAGTHPDTNKCCPKHVCVCKDESELVELCSEPEACKPGYTSQSVESDSCCSQSKCVCTNCVVDDQEIDVNEKYKVDECVTQICTPSTEEEACPYLTKYYDAKEYCPLFDGCGRYQKSYVVEYMSPSDDPNVCCTEYGCVCDESVLPESCPQWEDRMECSKYQQIEVKENQYHDESSCCPVLACVCKKDLKDVCPQGHDMECGEYETKRYLGMSNDTDLCCPMHECVKPPCHDPTGKPFKSEITYLTEDECCRSVCIEEEGEEARMETTCFMPSCSYTCEKDYFVPSIGTGWNPDEPCCRQYACICDTTKTCPGPMCPPTSDPIVVNEADGETLCCDEYDCRSARCEYKGKIYEANVTWQDECMYYRCLLNETTSIFETVKTGPVACPSPVACPDERYVHVENTSYEHECCKDYYCVCKYANVNGSLQTIGYEYDDPENPNCYRMKVVKREANECPVTEREEKFTCEDKVECGECEEKVKVRDDECCGAVYQCANKTCPEVKCTEGQKKVLMSNSSCCDEYACICECKNVGTNFGFRYRCRKRFSLIGNCTYLLSKDIENSKFEIYVKQGYCANLYKDEDYPLNQICYDLFRINYKNNNFECYMKTGRVFMNGNEIVRYNQYGVYIYRSLVTRGSIRYVAYLIIWLRDEGVIIFYRNPSVGQNPNAVATVDLYLTQRPKGTTGMCGSCDGNPEYECPSTGPLVTNEYAHDPTCLPPCGVGSSCAEDRCKYIEPCITCKNCTAMDNSDPCAALDNPVFDECHEGMNMTELKEQCYETQCYTSNDTETAVAAACNVCTSQYIQAHITECQTNGYCKNYQEIFGCDTTPGECLGMQVYKDCVDPCEASKTCDDLSSPPSGMCSQDKASMCTCPDGYVYRSNEEQECVKKECCSCPEPPECETPNHSPVENGEDECGCPKYTDECVCCPRCRNPESNEAMEPGTQVDSSDGCSVYTCPEYSAADNPSCENQQVTTAAKSCPGETCEAPYTPRYTTVPGYCCPKVECVCPDVEEPECDYEYQVKKYTEGECPKPICVCECPVLAPNCTEHPGCKVQMNKASEEGCKCVDSWQCVPDPHLCPAKPECAKCHTAVQLETVSGEGECDAECDKYQCQPAPCPSYFAPTLPCPRYHKEITVYAADDADRCCPMSKCECKPVPELQKECPQWNFECPEVYIARRTNSEDECCPEMECVCNSDACPEPIDCGYKELVTTNPPPDATGSHLEVCCPTYNCTCEGVVCPTAISKPACGRYERLSWVKGDSNECCMEYACECDPDTYPTDITAPQYKPDDEGKCSLPGQDPKPALDDSECFSRCVCVPEERFKIVCAAYKTMLEMCEAPKVVKIVESPEDDLDYVCCPKAECVCPDCGDDYVTKEAWEAKKKPGQIVVPVDPPTACCQPYQLVCDPDADKSEYCFQFIPSCGYGEKLQRQPKDADCCPTYKCVCDKSLCDAPPSCELPKVLGADDETSTVCCAAYKCVCPPDSNANVTCKEPRVESYTKSECPEKRCECPEHCPKRPIDCTDKPGCRAVVDAKDEECGCPLNYTCVGNPEPCDSPPKCSSCASAVQVATVLVVGECNSTCPKYECRKKPCPAYVAPTEPCSKYQQEVSFYDEGDEDKCCPKQVCECKPREELEEICDEWYDMECEEYETKSIVGMRNGTDGCCPAVDCVKPPCADPEGAPFTGSISYEYEDKCCTRTCIEKDGKAEMKVNCFVQTCHYTCDDDHRKPSLKQTWQEDAPCCRDYDCICDTTMCPVMMCTPAANLTLVKKADGIEFCCDEYECKSAKCVYRGEYYEPDATWKDECSQYTCLYNDTSSQYEAEYGGPTPCPPTTVCEDERYELVEDSEQNDPCCKSYHCVCRYYLVNGTQQEIGYEYDDPENPNCYRMKVVKREANECPVTEREEKFTCEDEVECGECEEKVKVRDDECCGAVYQCVNFTCPVVNCTSEQKKVLMSTEGCCDDYECVCECKDLSTNYAFRYRCRQSFRLDGNCSYLLTKDVDSDKFEIYVKQSYCKDLYPSGIHTGYQMCYEKLTMRYKNVYFEFFVASGKVFQNGNEVQRYNHYSVGVYRFTVKRDGVEYVAYLYLILRNEGVIILYRNPDIGKNPNAVGTIDLYLTSRPKGTTGACGSCDGNPEYECPSFSPAVYQQNTECPPPCQAENCHEERCKDAQPCVVCRNCTYYGYSDPCDHLDDPVFESCNSGDDREALRASCRKEQCFTDNDTASAIEAQCNVCTSLFIQQRVTHCKNNGYCKDYQVELDCEEGNETCKSYEEFRSCVDACDVSKTCEDINENRECGHESKLVSSCVCPEGYYYRDDTRQTCVKEECCNCPAPPECEEGPNFAPTTDGVDGCLCPNYTGDCYCCPYCKNPDTGELINPGKSVPTRDGCGAYICPEHDPVTNPNCLTLEVIHRENPCPTSKCVAPRVPRYTTPPGYCCPDEECICPEVEEPECEYEHQTIQYTEGECPKPICVCECPVLAPNCTEHPGCKVQMNKASEEGCKCVDSWQCVPDPELCPVEPECAKCHDLKVYEAVPGEGECDAQCNRYQCVHKDCPVQATVACSEYEQSSTYYPNDDLDKCCPLHECECKPNAKLKDVCEQWFDFSCGEYEEKQDLGWQEDTSDCCPAYRCVCDTTKCPTTECESTEDLVTVTEADGDEVCCDVQECKSVRCLYSGKHYEPNATWLVGCYYYSCQYNATTILYETSDDGPKPCPVTEPCPDERYVQTEDPDNDDECCKKYLCECKYANVNGSLQTIGYEYDDPGNPNCYRMKVVKREANECPVTEREEKFTCEDEVECGECEEKVKVRDDECCGAVYQCENKTCPEVTCNEDQEKVFVSNDTCCDKYECRCKCKDLGTSYSLRFRCRQQFKLNGNCTYLLAREVDDERFEISVKQTHCSNLFPTQTYTNYQLCYEVVILRYKNNRYEMFPTSGKVLLNGNEITDRSHYFVKVARGYVWRHSIKYVAYIVIWLTEEGTAIVYRNPHVGKNTDAIGIIDVYMAARQTTGVCGNCGGGPGYECPDYGPVVTNEYQQDSTCLPPCDTDKCHEERCKDSPPCIVCRNCSYFGYDDPCAALDNPVFDSCVANQTKRDEAKRLCRQEICFSENETASVVEAQCNVCKSMYVQMFVSHCQQGESCKNYQKALDCEDGEATCTGNEVYKECIDSCEATKTCKDLTTTPDQTICGDLVSMCTCPDDYVYRDDANAECIREECCTCPDPEPCDEGPNYSPVVDGTDACGCKNYTDKCVCCPRCRNPESNEAMEPGTQVDSSDGCSIYTCPEYSAADNPSCENQQVTTAAKSCPGETCEAPYTPRYTTVPGYCCPKVECVCPDVEEPECDYDYQVKKYTEGECPKPICVCECPVLAPNCTEHPGCKVQMNKASEEGCKCVDSWQCVPDPELCPVEPECAKCHDLKVDEAVPGEGKCDAQCNRYQCVRRECPDQSSNPTECPEYQELMREYAEGDVDQCCPIAKCVCKPNTVLQKECPQWTDYTCDAGWRRRVISDVSDCCPQIECVCDYDSCAGAPDCEYKNLVTYSPLTAGTHDEQCCYSYECTCVGVECEGIGECGQYKKVVATKDEDNECCPIQTCVCDPEQYPEGYDAPEIRPTADGTCGHPGQVEEPEYDESGCLPTCVCYPPGQLPGKCPEYARVKAECPDPKYIVATDAPADDLDYVCCPLYQCVCPECGDDYVTKEELEADLEAGEIVVPDGKAECCQPYMKVCRPDADQHEECVAKRPACDEGYKLQRNEENDGCCPAFTCVCDLDICTNPPDCPENQYAEESRAEGQCCATYKCVCPPNNYDNVTCVPPKVAAYSDTVCPKKYCECPEDCPRDTTIDCTDKPGCRAVVTHRDECGCALNSSCEGDRAPCPSPPDCPQCYSPTVVGTKLVVGDCNSTCEEYKCTRDSCGKKKPLPQMCTLNTLSANNSNPCCPVTEVICTPTCPREKCKEGYHAELTDEYWSDDYACAPGLDCCPKERCVCDVCFYKEKPFKVGERWHPDDSCNVLSCTGTRTGDCFTITERRPHCLYVTDNGTEIVLSVGAKLPVPNEPCKAKVCRISADCVETIEDYNEVCPPPTQCNAFQTAQIERIPGVCCPKTTCICKACEPDHTEQPEGDESEYTVVVNQTLDENPNQVCCPRSKYDCAGPEVLSQACPQWNKTCPMGKERVRSNDKTKCCPEYICVCKQDCNYKKLNPPLEHACHERVNKTVEENPIQECCPASYVQCMEDKACCGPDYTTYEEVKENLEVGEEILHNEDSHECCPLYEPVCKQNVEDDLVCARYRRRCIEGYKEIRQPENVGCCPAYTCVCDETLCPAKPDCETPKELKMVGTSGPCCNTWECVCPAGTNVTVECVAPEQIYWTKSVCPTSYCRCPESLECPVNADVENCRSKTGCRPEVTERDACDCVTNSTCVYDPSLCPPKRTCDDCYRAVSEGPLPGVGDCKPTCESYTCERIPCPYAPKPAVCEVEQVYTNYDGCCESYTVKCKSSACPSPECGEGYRKVIDDDYVDSELGCTNGLDCCRRVRCVCDVCLFNGGVYELGATWTDPDEPCATYECSSARDSDMCYVPREVPPTCEHDGSSYPPGATVTTNNPCTDLVCAKKVTGGTCTYEFEEKRKTCPGKGHCEPYYVARATFRAGVCCPTYDCVCADCGDDYVDPSTVREPEWYETKRNLTLEENPNQVCCPMVTIVCDDTQLHKCESEALQCGYGKERRSVDSDHPCCPAYECVCKECRDYDEPSEEDLQTCQEIVYKDSEENPNGECCPEKKVACKDVATCCDKVVCGKYEDAKPTGEMDGCCATQECVCKPSDYLTSNCPFANFTCPVGYKSFRNNSDDECCSEYECKCVSCVVDGVAYPVGYSWTDSDDHCVTMECFQEEGNCPEVRSSPKYTCAAVNETECTEAGGELLPTTDTEGCCQACKMCVPEDELVIVEIVTGKGPDGEDVTCVSDEKVNVPTCTGACKTTSEYNLKTNEFESKCRCCAPLHSRKQTVLLHCDDGLNFNYEFDYVIECGCHETKCVK